MGFFDRFAGKKTAGTPAAPVAAPTPVETPAPAPAPAASGNVMPRLVTARERIEARDLPGALAIYEEVLATAGDRADVLVTISGDLGVNGHTREIVELVAPRYDAERHGPATGLNLLQAYLALRHAEAAQHVLDILFGLNRPELEERLHGFSNAIAELIHSEATPLPDPATGAATAAAEPPRVNVVSISKPIWFYGLENLAGVLPPKSGKARRVAFAQLATPGLADPAARAQQPEDELGRLSRAIPLWLTEVFYFSPHYLPWTAVGVMGAPGTPGHYAIFPTEWTTDNLRQLVDSVEGGLDYLFTGALRQQAGDWELVLRLWEVKKFRERKQFTIRWTPATAEAELTKLQEGIRAFMEWAPYPAGQGPMFMPAVRPEPWLGVLGSSLTLFLAGKNLLAPAQLAGVPDALENAAGLAAGSETQSLAWFTLRTRARQLGVAPGTLGEALVFKTPLVEQAATMV